MKKSDEKENQPKILRIHRYLTSQYDIRVNLISSQLEARKKGKGDFQSINEGNLLFELYEKGFTKPKEEFKVLMTSDKIPRFDPFSTYFESLDPWDPSQPDHIAQLASFVQTDDDYFWKLMFPKHLIRTVAQALGSDHFNKQCLTLVGKQNDGKTRFLDFLVPPALINYYRKHFDFGSKEGKISLTQNFLINLDELATFEKKELNSEFKSVLSESVIRYTPKFANYETSFRRRASFVATTNKTEFLTDETGNVRWVPFMVKSINHDNGGEQGYGQQVNIDRVWAQAYYLFKTGETGQLSKDDISQLEKLNKRFMVITTEAEIIQLNLRPAHKKEDGAEFMPSTAICEYLKEKTTLRLYDNQIGKALSSLGFERTGGNYNEQWVKGYYVIKVEKMPPKLP